MALGVVGERTRNCSPLGVVAGEKRRVGNRPFATFEISVNHFNTWFYNCSTSQKPYVSTALQQSSSVANDTQSTAQKYIVMRSWQ